MLPLPPTEVLGEAAAATDRHGSVLHLLETTIVGWIKQLKVWTLFLLVLFNIVSSVVKDTQTTIFCTQGLLKHAPLQDLRRKFGPCPRPMDEVMLWTKRLEMLLSIGDQLDTPVAQNLLQKLADVNSAYATAFQGVRKDILKVWLVRGLLCCFFFQMVQVFFTLTGSSFSTGGNGCARKPQIPWSTSPVVQKIEPLCGCIRNVEDLSPSHAHTVSHLAAFRVSFQLLKTQVPVLLSHIGMRFVVQICCVVTTSHATSVGLWRSLLMQCAFVQVLPPGRQVWKLAAIGVRRSRSQSGVVRG